MNRQLLRDLLIAEHVRPDSYSIDGTVKDESLCLELVSGSWVVFYSERGLRSGERQFETEDEACDFLARRLLEDPSNRNDVVDELSRFRQPNQSSSRQLRSHRGSDEY